MKNQLSQIVIRLLNDNSIIYDKNELEFQIQSHPSYPSLHSITGVLNHFNIENIAAKVPSSSKTLIELPDSFLAQINDNNGQSLVTVKKNKNKLSIFNGAKQTVSLLKEEFIEKFTGIIVAVEKSENKRQAYNFFSFSKKISLVFLFGLFFYLFFNWTTNINTYLHILLSILGILISIAIVKKEMGLQSTLGNAFCSSNSEKKDCDAVLTSKGAEIIKDYKLSDFSLLYFSTVFLLTFILQTNQSIVYTLSLVALPITIYSIFYQYKVVKKWCLLCLTIVGILWLQGIIAFIAHNYNFNFEFKELVAVLFCISFTFFFWKYLKPFVLELNALRKEKLKATKFKRNYSLFSTMLNSVPSLDTKIEDVNEIVFGNLKANLELIVITNPFCGHCKQVHKIVEDILAKYSNEVKIVIRFNIRAEDSHSDVVKITTRLLEIYATNKEDCLLAMSDIYEKMPVKSWLKKWGNCKEKEGYISILKKEKGWCTENNINFTPEILINGKGYPKEYNKTDLLYFIEELSEQKN